MPPKSKSSIFLLLALPVLLWLGLRNRPDPLWAETGRLLQAPNAALYQLPDSLQYYYSDIHHQPYTPGDSTAWRFVAMPWKSNVDWQQFSQLLATARTEKYLVVAGVTGAGATKYSKHLARLLAGDQQHLLEINCAPQFDLDYHRKYIGAETETGYEEGILLDFWNQCRQHPQENYVCLVDNFDKINPETFFGPTLWEALSSRTDSFVLNGTNRAFPNNFYLIATTHLGPGSLVDFNEEHFKRLGRQYILEPNNRELWMWLQKQAESLAKKEQRSESEQKQLDALRDTAQMHRFIYSFAKANTLVRTRYGPGYQLGQGSNARYCFGYADGDKLQQTFMEHLSALRPSRSPAKNFFSEIDYAADNDGYEPGTSFLAQQIQFLQDTGYLVEISMVATTALLTALAGWWVFRRREQLMREYGDRAQTIFNRFETEVYSADAASNDLYQIKQEVDQLVMHRKLNYTEALYFLAFIDDKLKRIEFARNVSENFLDLFNAFMEDNVMSDGEYSKLIQFLDSIRHKIPEAVYHQYRDKVQRTYDGIKN